MESAHYNSICFSFGIYDPVGDILQTVKTSDWQLNLPDHWQTETVDDSLSLFDPASNGTLMVSSTRETYDISDEYLEDLLDQHLDPDAELYELELGNFDGVMCCYESEGEYWCEWFLRCNDVMLYVTYNCPLDDEGSEDDVVESILESIQYVESKQIH